MKRKKVSVIIPTKNSSRTLSRCLASVREQSYNNIEIIVVDNNSNDTTKEIAESYADKILNLGPERSIQRNFGAANSTGDFLLFIDSDMVLTKHVIREAVNIFKDGNCAMVVIPEKSFGQGFWAECKSLERSFYIGIDWMEAARFFKKDIFDEIGGYDPNNTGTEDYDLPQRIQSKHGINVKARIESFIYHDEGKIELIKLLKKKFYYAKNLRNYSSKNENKHNFKSQSSLLKRYILFFGKPKLIVKKPVIFVSMLIMKTLEFISGGIGLYSR